MPSEEPGGSRPRPVRCLVRRPSPRLADGLLTHLERVPVDADLARRQWRAYVDALEAEGWETIEVPPLDDAPDGAFVEDALVTFDDLAVTTRPGAPERRVETASLAAAADALGLERVALPAPARLDGGDVLKVGRTAYVGLGGRTDRAGVEALGRAIGPRGWTVVPVPVTRALHLKSAVTALPDGTVIGHPATVDDPARFPDFLAVPEPEGAHAVVLGDARVLISAGAPRTIELLGRRGVEAVAVEIGEFEKLEGCVTCLSVRVR